jgi:hypothetical protein
MFQVHAVMHHPKTRQIRAQAAVHPRHKQFILKDQRRLIPNKPIAVSADEVLENLTELRSLEAQGIIELRTDPGEIVSLKDFNVSPLPPVPPSPKFKQDSAQDDPPRGKSAVFTPDTTEVLTTQEGEHAGGGMTDEAIAQSKEDQDLPPLPEELKYLEEEEEPKVAAAAPVEGNDFGGPPMGDTVDEEEPDVEHEESPKTKKRRR